MSLLMCWRQKQKLLFLSLPKSSDHIRRFQVHELMKESLSKVFFEGGGRIKKRKEVVEGREGTMGGMKGLIPSKSPLAKT